MSIEALKKEAAKYPEIMKNFRKTGKQYTDPNFYPTKHYSDDPIPLSDKIVG